MSQPYEYPPPPPSPGVFQHSLSNSNVGVTQAVAGGRGAVGNFQVHEQRHRPAPAAPPTITTSFDHRSLTNPAGSSFPVPGTPAVNYRPSQPRQVLATPVSAFSTRAANSPFSQTSASPASASPMEPYNPRQWSNTGAVSGTQMVFARSANVPLSTRETTGMETALPSPPPPYSSDNDAGGNTPVATTRMSAMQNVMYAQAPNGIENSAARTSPQVQSSPAFPPPPGSGTPSRRERSSSGIGGQRSIFSHLRGKQPARSDVPVNAPVQTPVQAPAPAPNPALTTFEARPPAARRAASAGQVHPHNSSDISERAPPDNSWQPGMPLPGPPPGPPPPGARSQSLNRVPGSSTSGSNLDVASSSRAPGRRIAARSTLGPVPPTPAGWIDQDSVIVNDSRSTEPPPLPEEAFQSLRIDTSNASSSSSSNNRDSFLARRLATRDSSAQGIRERRSKSRQARYGDIVSPVDDESRPSDLVFTPVYGSISQRREHAKLRHPDSVSAPSSATLPRPPGSGKPASASVMTPPYTPAVNDGTNTKKPLVVPGSATSDRPISHLLHAPNEDAAMPAPLSPARPSSAGVAKRNVPKLNTFSLQAIERHRAFIEKEAAAASDGERLELFAQFMVHESRLRRDRYTNAYNAMAGDIVDLTRDMWRSYVREGKRVATPSTSMSSGDPTVPSWASDGQRSAHLNEPNSASSFGDMTPGTEASLLGENGEPVERSESRQWGEIFKPSLSPIPSMTVSTVPDDSSSRGRQPSRWWEQSASGGSIGRPDRMERSHRETKYMGINPAALIDASQESPREHTSTPGASSMLYSADEYPPEKVGWHDEYEMDTPMPTPGRRPRQASDPGPDLLDVSRLVTLPPPYPRHHPAVNNSHPLLSEVRASYRQLADHTGIQKIKDGYLDQDFVLQKQLQDASKERKARLRQSIQGKISSGGMTFAEAAKAEAKFEQEERERGKANARATFDLYEASVAQPLNLLLTERLEKADKGLQKLKDELESRNEISDPNQAQEEGDNQPERLEKLTLYKWVFEAREQLHKEMFELHSQRSEKYSEVILTPYRISKLQNKIDEATAFFKKDGVERQRAFTTDSLKRYEELQNVIESNVSRGVEDQLSAFWDIAPSLTSVIQNIPQDRDGFEIAIPSKEYEENPTYHNFPLQYLYTLLNHAEKSAYQFIESQTNLLCLLHEVRTATAKSRLRALELERSPSDPSLAADLLEAGRFEENRLTDDLKDKVGEVERQWQEALGDSIQHCKSQVRGWLQESGGWEDGLDE